MTTATETETTVAKMERMSDDDLNKFLDSHAQAIMEHCDSVRIFATVHDPSGGETKMLTRGQGNYYAQFGSVKEWLARIDEYDREYIRQVERRPLEGDEL